MEKKVPQWCTFCVMAHRDDNSLDRDGEIEQNLYIGARHCKKPKQQQRNKQISINTEK